MIFKSFSRNQKAGMIQIGEPRMEKGTETIHEATRPTARHDFRAWPLSRPRTENQGADRLGYPVLELALVKSEAEEACEFCAAKLSEQHRHLLDISRRTTICACDLCTFRFENPINGRFKLIPQDTSFLPDFRLTGVQWENLGLPVNVVFIYYDRLTQRPVAKYPGPNGAAEAPMTVADWQSILAGNPGLEDLKPDVEALLLDRSGETPGYFRVPIDVCFELVRLTRRNWRGFAGGDRVWLEIETFFARLREQTTLALRQGLPLNEVHHA
jgi:hypothetical protein